MRGRIFYWSLTSALAGFLFGFDTVVISGAEQKIQSLWGLTAGMHGIAMAAALYGTVLGSILGGWPTDRFGRKATLLGIGILYVISAIGGHSPGTSIPSCGAFYRRHRHRRVHGGRASLHFGDAPPAHRGRLAGMFQFNIVFGIVVAFPPTRCLAGIGENAWRWMLGVAAFPSVLYTLMCLAFRKPALAPHSQRRSRRRIARASDSSARSHSCEIAKPVRTKSSPQLPSNAVATRFLVSELRVPILLAFLVAFFNQLSGINAILYFAPRIFELTGLGQKAALLQSVGIGVTNLGIHLCRLMAH